MANSGTCGYIREDVIEGRNLAPNRVVDMKCCKDTERR